MTRLRQKMLEDLRLRDLRDGTSKTYIRSVAAFARFHGGSPELLGTAEVRGFLLHLANLRRAPATRVVYHAAITFLFAHTLGRPDVMALVPRPGCHRPEWRSGPDSRSRSRAPSPLPAKRLPVCPLPLAPVGRLTCAPCRTSTSDIGSGQRATGNGQRATGNEQRKGPARAGAAIVQDPVQLVFSVVE